MEGGEMKNEWGEDEITDTQRKRLAKIGARISWAITGGDTNLPVTKWVITDKNGSQFFCRRRESEVDAIIFFLEQEP